MKLQRKTVHAVAQAGRLWTVIEDVAEMAAAATAMNFAAQHAEGAIFPFAHGIIQRLIEARPAGAAFVLRLGREQRQVATGAGEGAFAVFLEQRARPRTLGTFLAQDFVLLRRQLGAPFRVGLFDLELFSGVRGFTAQPTQRRKAKQTGSSSKQDTAIDHLISPCEASYRFCAKYGPPERKLHPSDGQFLTFLRGDRGKGISGPPRPGLPQPTAPAARQAGGCGELDLGPAGG